MGAFLKGGGYFFTGRGAPSRGFSRRRNSSRRRGCQASLKGGACLFRKGGRICFKGGDFFWVVAT